MSETSEVVQSTINELLKRVDALAEKLGITAEHIWEFTVRAQLAQAKRDLLLGVSRLLAPAILWLYVWFIWNMPLPHDTDSHGATGDLTSGGYALGFSALLAFAAGLIVLFVAIEEILDGITEFKTAEYDAFTDLLSDLRG